LHRVEVEDAVALDHDLTVERRVGRQQLADLAQLREITQQRPSVPAPDGKLALQVLHHSAKAVPLRLVLPVAFGELGDELGLHRWEGKVSRRHFVGRLVRVGELDGVWEVRRTGGALPPLLGVRKEISGAAGTTKVGPLPGVPFDVVGLSLRYRAPLVGFVDVLERDGEGFRGRATFRGREFGKFELKRIELSLKEEGVTV